MIEIVAVAVLIGDGWVIQTFGFLQEFWFFQPTRHCCGSCPIVRRVIGIGIVVMLMKFMIFIRPPSAFLIHHGSILRLEGLGW